MRGVHAVTLCLLIALALSGCMRTSSPVAGLQPQSDLDSLAYGPPTKPAIEPASRSDVADSGGAIAALRRSFAAAPRRAYAPVPVAYAAAPMPPAHDAPYRLPARGKNGGVGYGPGGLTNTYSIDGGGAR